MSSAIHLGFRRTVVTIIHNFEVLRTMPSALALQAGLQLILCSWFAVTVAAVRVESNASMPAWTSLLFQLISLFLNQWALCRSVCLYWKSYLGSITGKPHATLKTWTFVIMPFMLWKLKVYLNFEPSYLFALAPKLCGQSGQNGKYFFVVLSSGRYR